MKNKLVLLNEEEKEQYNPLLKVDIKDEEYLIYTKNEKNDCEDIICYVGKYIFKNGRQIIEPIKNSNILEVLDMVLLQVQNILNKNESSELNNE